MKKNKDILNLDTNNLQKRHQKELGFSVPKEYFEASKIELLNISLHASKQSTSKSHKINTFWFAAASVMLLLSIGILSKHFINNKSNIPQVVLDTLNPLKQELLTLDVSKNQDEILISSLFVAEENIDAYLDEAFINEALQLD